MSEGYKKDYGSIEYLYEVDSGDHAYLMNLGQDPFKRPNYRRIMREIKDRALNEGIEGMSKEEKYVAAHLLWSVPEYQGRAVELGLERIRE